MRRRLLPVLFNSSAQYVTLPQNLLSNAGTQIEGYEDATDWTVSAGSAANNTTEGEFRIGTQSIKLTSPSGADGIMDKTVSIASYGASGTTFRVSFYLHDASTLLTQITVLVFFLGGGYGYANASVANDYVHQGWNTIFLFPSDFVLESGGVWTRNINKIRMIVRPVAGQVANVSFDELKAGVVGTAAVMFTFDDEFISQYDTAYPYMQARNMRGTIYIRGSNVGGAGFATGAQLQEMDAAGWCMGNHTQNHLNLSTLTQAEVEAEIAAGKATLDTWGLTKAHDFFAYPGGDANPTVFAACAAQGVLLARVAGGRGHSLIADNTDMDLVITQLGLQMTTTLEAAKAQVDKAVADKSLLVCMCHKVTDTNPLDIDWTAERFTGLIDYMQSKNLPFITIKDYYDLKSGAITVQIV